jgi:hypothetical protein
LTTKKVDWNRPYIITRVAGRFYYTIPSSPFTFLRNLNIFLLCPKSKLTMSGIWIRTQHLNHFPRPLYTIASTIHMQ